MKKLFILTILTITVSSYAMSQFGAQAGLTSASIKAKVGDEDETSDARLGFTLGVLYRLSLGNLSIQPELNFTQKGGKQEESGFSYSETFNYLELPIYLMYVAASKKEAASNSGF